MVSAPTDTEGYLVNKDDWTPEIAREIAQEDGFDITEKQFAYIHQARQMYDNLGIVPVIRKFAKACGVKVNDLYKDFHTGPMKVICKWGGLPRPTGCV